MGGLRARVGRRTIVVAFVVMLVLLLTVEAAGAAQTTSTAGRDHDHRCGSEDDPPRRAPRARDLVPGDLVGGPRPLPAAESRRLFSRRARSRICRCAACAACPSLADGYVTIGAGTRSVAHAGDDGECLETASRSR